MICVCMLTYGYLTNFFLFFYCSSDRGTGEGVGGSCGGKRQVAQRTSPSGSHINYAINYFMFTSSV